MADPTSKNPNAEKSMVRADRPLRRADEGYPGTVPSRDPDASASGHAHHQQGDRSQYHRDDPRGLRESDPRVPYDRNDAARRHNDATRRDDTKARVRADVDRHLRDHRGR